MQIFYHIRENQLPTGSLISPGRWGSTVLSIGSKHPFFFREHLLEVWRMNMTGVAVSRFDCTFAHESEAQAKQYQSVDEFIHRVVPVNKHAASARLDMLWLTWMGEPNATTEKISQWCIAYWAGKATDEISAAANPSWEHLFACPLRVI